MSNSIDWSEFFKNEHGKESADRLLLLASFPFATFMTLWIGNTEALVIYLGAYGILAGNNKWAMRNANSTLGVEKLAAGSDSDTVSAASVTGSIVESRRTQTTKRRKRPF